MGQAREGARDQVGVGRIAIRFVVAFGAGGAADRVARAFASSLADERIVVENVPGEGGLAGVRRANALVAESRGAVLLLGTPSTHILLPARLGPSAVPDRALEPLIGLGYAPNVLLASARLDLHSVEELIARAASERLVYASAGTGQTIHVCTAYFCALAGIRMIHRAYDAGSAHAYADLASGKVHVYFDNLLACREAIESGDVVPLAVSAKGRDPLMPSVPALAECGFPDHALDIWFGVFGARFAASRLRQVESARSGADLPARLARIGLSGGVSEPGPFCAGMARSEEGWKRALAAAR